MKRESALIGLLGAFISAQALGASDPTPIFPPSETEQQVAREEEKAKCEEARKKGEQETVSCKEYSIQAKNDQQGRKPAEGDPAWKAKGSQRY